MDERIAQVQDTLNSAASTYTHPPGVLGTGRVWLWRVLRVLTDLALIGLSFVAAYWLRYTLQIGRDIAPAAQQPFDDYAPLLLAYSLTLLAILQLRGFYRLARSSTWLDEVGLVASSAVTAVGIIIVFAFALRHYSDAFLNSRLLYAYLPVITVVAIGAERTGLRLVRRWLWRRGIGVRNVLVVGTTEAARRVMATLVTDPNLGYRLVGYVDDELRFAKWTLPLRYGGLVKPERDGEAADSAFDTFDDDDAGKPQRGAVVPYLGAASLDAIARHIDAHAVKEVIIALPAAEHSAIADIINELRQRQVDFTLVPDLFELRINALNLTEINGVPLIGLRATAITGWNLVLKRALDIGLALLGLIVLALPMALLAAAIHFDSPGPILFRQKRMGKNGRLFTVLKFRSMMANAEDELERLRTLNEADGPLFKMKNDPRTTRLGRIIRKVSVDELPQLFNILLGHMSFVGPRPPLPSEVLSYQRWHLRRLEVTPGLTGLWQVSGRSELSFDDMVKLDIYYAENWSLWLDVKIMLRTIPAVLLGKGAY